MTLNPRTLLTLLLLASLNSFGQNTIAPYDLEQEAFLVKQERLPLYSSVRPLQFNFDSTFKYQETPALNKFRKRFLTDQPLIAYNDKNTEFFLNPVIDVMLGSSNSNNVSKSTWHFGRGFHGGATFNKKWQIDFSFVENQSKTPYFLDSFVNNSYRSLPGLGQVKVTDDRTYDYSYTNGFLRWMPTNKFSATLGHGQHFLGEGYRSLFLSDNAYNYPYLQLNLNTRHVHYMVLFSQYTNLFKKFNDTYQRKWSAMNYLNIAISKRFQLGLFQGVIWQDRDSTGKRGFDVQYLIPTTIVRPIEFSQGSADNTFLGIHANYKVGKSMVSYFQLFLDDINIRETFKNNKQHINNKYAIQLGLKGYNDFSDVNLRWRIEYNYSRPYTYGHRKIEQSYTHYHQPIAHPVGANFHEGIFAADLTYKRWYGTFLGQYARVGRDDKQGYNDGNNLFGGEDGVPELGTKTLQGNKQNQVTVQAVAGFILNRSWRTGIEARVFYKDQKSVSGGASNSTTWFQVGIVTRLRNQYFEF